MTNKIQVKKMTNIFTFKIFLILVFMISMLACKSSESTENSESKSTKVINSSLNQVSIKLIDNKDVILKHQLGNKTEFGENFMIEIECLVINKTKEDINYLNNSCNGLDYHLVIKPDSYKVRPFINCNASWEMISTLASRDSLKFKTQILQLKDSEPIEKIGLFFIAVDKFIPFDTLRNNPELVDNIYQSVTEIDNVIWGNKK